MDIGWDNDCEEQGGVSGSGCWVVPFPVERGPAEPPGGMGMLARRAKNYPVLFALLTIHPFLERRGLLKSPFGDFFTLDPIR